MGHGGGRERRPTAVVGTHARADERCADNQEKERASFKASNMVRAGGFSLHHWRPWRWFELCSLATVREALGTVR